MAFDITSVLGDIARIQEEENRKKLEYIELHLIDTNPRNYYSMDGIEELAANIQLLGLMEPLIVKDTGGRYMLISGHRRRAALRMLAESGDLPEGMHWKVPCIVESGPVLAGEEQLDRKDLEKARALAEELKLIFANSDTRILSSADTAQQVRRIRELFTELKDLGYEFPGRMRDHVAAAAKVSATRVARLDVIEKGLTEEVLRDAWEDGDLRETTAYEIARRNGLVQEAAADQIGLINLMDMTTEQVVEALDAISAEMGRKSTAPKDAEPASVTDNLKSSFSVDEYRANRQREDAFFREAVNRNLQQMIRSATYYANDINFLDMERAIAIDKIKKGGYHGGGSIDGGFFDLDSKGVRFDIDGYGRISRTWTELYDAMAAAALEAVRQRPEQKKVSTADTPVLKTGTPTKQGEYMTRCGVGTEDTRQTTRWQCLEWHDGCWCYPKNGTPLPKGTSVFSWFRLPEV